MIEVGVLLGCIGSICFALCGVPQVLMCVKQGHANGVSGMFLILWLLGEVFYTGATFIEFGPVPWLLFNYALNAICIFIIGYYYYCRPGDKR